MDILRRILKIVIDGNDNVVLRRPYAAQNRVVLAEVAHEMDGNGPWIAIRFAVQHSFAAIPAAIVDQDDFIPGGESGKYFLKASEQDGKAIFRVINRNDDRKRVDQCVYRYALNAGDCSIQGRLLNLKLRTRIPQFLCISG